jgi:dipeptidyl aminopeptidase/acylaminoacyl peptidase
MKKILSIVVLGLSLTFLGITLGWSADAKKETGIPPLIPRDVLFGNPVKASPRISPDGTNLAFLAPSDKGVMNVWIQPLDGAEAGQLTREDHRGIKTFYWTAEGGGILYLQDTNGDENFHVLMTDLSTKVTRDLTPLRGVRAVNLVPLRDEILVGLNIRKRQLFDIYRIDLQTGAVRLDTENPGDVAFLVGDEWTADRSGVIRAVRTVDFKDGSTILRVRDGQDSPWRELARWPNGSLFDGNVLGFDKEGGALYVISSTGKNTAGLVRIDLHTGRETAPSFGDPRCDIFPDSVLLHPDKRTIQAFVVDYLKRDWTVVDPDLVEDFNILRSSLKGFFRVVSRDAADAMWVVDEQPADGPVSTYLYDRKARRVRFMFADRPELNKHALAPMKPMILTGRDGLKMTAYLTLPVGMKPENLPMVLYVHGGPTARDEFEYEPIVQLLANRGYAVLQVNFRGSVGFGKSFQKAGDREIGVGAMQNDLTDAVRWAIKEKIADPERIAIFGISYGGYATLAGLAFTPDLYACGAEMCGPSRIKTVLESVPSYYGPIKDLFVRIFGDAEKDEAWDRKVSPLFHVDKIGAPLLVGQGTNDPRCNIRESDQIVKAMRDRNLPVTYIVYPDEGHGLNRQENKLDFFGRLEEFLAQHLGGRCEPYRIMIGSTGELR